MIYDPIAAGPSGHPGIDGWNGLLNAICPSLGCPPNLLKAHMLYESGGNPGVIAPDGGCGLMQITTGVIQDGGKYLYEGRDILEPAFNITVACRDFIAKNLVAFPGYLDAAIAAYNAGAEAVAAHLGDPSAVTSDPWYVYHVREAFSWLNQTARKT